MVFFSIFAQCMEDIVTLQSITDNQYVHIGYSDDDIVLIDNLRRFTEIRNTHISMNAISICLNGKVQALMNGNFLKLQRNQVVIMPPEVIISDLMVSPDFEAKVLFLSNNMLHSFLHDKMGVWNEVMYVRRVHVFDVDDEGLHFYRLFYELMGMCIKNQSKNPIGVEVVQSLIRSALLAICGMFTSLIPEKDGITDKQTADSYFQGFLQLLHREEIKHRSVEWYAGNLFISPKYLSLLCKRYSGKTANEWITEHVMEDIRYYLRQTNLSIKQISNRLGFSNPSFFGKYVKEHFGVTPIQLRNR